MDERYYESEGPYISPAAARVRRKDPLKGACSEPLDARLRATYRNVAEYFPVGDRQFARKALQVLTNLKHGRVVLEYAAQDDVVREYVARRVAAASGQMVVMDILGSFTPPADLQASLDVVLQRITQYS